MSIYNLANNCQAWLERSLNMVTFSPEQRAIVTSEERFLVVDSVVGAKSVALVVEHAVSTFTLS